MVDELFGSLVARGKVVGAVVGLVIQGSHAVRAYGQSGVASEPSLGGGTIFEVGSITKVFTGLLLAQMAQTGEVRLEDPVGKFLTAEVATPRRGSRQITLLDLATHTSGLPRLPRNLLWKALREPSDPYSRYTTEDLHRAISRAKIDRGIGERFRYSNFGFGLLGHALSRAAGTSYETLVVERVCRPLGMTDTAIEPPPGSAGRRAQGHEKRGKPVSDWHLPALAGAGALRSTAEDMVRFLGANIEPRDTRLAQVLEAAQAPHRTIAAGTESVGLGWFLSTKEGRTVVWHDGGTGGFGAFAGFDRAAGVGVVALCNSRHSPKIDRAGFRLLARLAEGRTQGRRGLV